MSDEFNSLLINVLLEEEGKVFGTIKPPGECDRVGNTSLSVKQRQGMYRNRLKAVLLRHWLQDLAYQQ
jgi:hypothetical protein